MVTGSPLRVVFMGTPEFAVPTLQALLASRHEVVAVITQPDRPRGRGQKVVEGPVKACAVAAGVPVLQPLSLNTPEFMERLASFRADLGVVAAYGRILSEAVIGTPRLGMINVHASLLPSYRGAAPIHRAVADGASETGVTIMRVVKALDAGAMLATVRRPIGPDDTSEEVERDLARLGAELLVATVDRMAVGPIEEVPQDASLATYAHRLVKDDGLIDWSRPAREIHNQVRGMRPWPNAFSYLQGKRLIVLRSSVEDDGGGPGVTGNSGTSGTAIAGDVSPTAAAPGTIVAVHPEAIGITTGAGLLLAREVQAEGKRPMTVRDFLAGHRLAVGDRFTAAP